MTSSLESATISPTDATSAAALAGAARPDRNRAVDAYRAVAMLAVAVGHWVVVHTAIGDDALPTGTNALALTPGLSWLTWLFQVMPLFFVVGGFSSARSLDAHFRKGGTAHEWVGGRLRRMLAPTTVLAGTWVALVASASAVGWGGPAGTALVGAAIPLWFLANYTIDTAVAPYLIPRFRSAPAKVGGLLVGAFFVVEVVRAFGVPLVPQINWVLGWLLFQMLGAAWSEGIVTSKLAARLAAPSWVAAVSLVAFGPWPVTMIHVPGVGPSPTHPPSTALMVFGLAYSLTAIAFAPAVDRFLASTRGAEAWVAVVAGNGVAMTVYLWHMTTAVVATLVVWQLGLVPDTDPGTAAWWLAKVPFVLVAAAALVPMVWKLSPIERNALLSGSSEWRHGPVATAATAAGVSTSIKLWSIGSAAPAVAGAALLVVIWRTAVRADG